MFGKSRPNSQYHKIGKKLKKEGMVLIQGTSGNYGCDFWELHGTFPN
jgi:hypothetical protein